MAFSPDGRLLAAGHADGTNTVWDLAGSTEGTVFREKGGRRYFLLTDHSPAVGFAPDCKLLATGRTENGRKPVRLWNAVTGQLLGSLEDQNWAHGTPLS